MAAFAAVELYRSRWTACPAGTAFFAAAGVVHDSVYMYSIHL
jgi:hypothetical protein